MLGAHLNIVVGGPFKLVGKIKLKGPGPPGSILLLITVVCVYSKLYAKMLKETKTEETIVFFVTFFIIGSISIGGGAGSPLWLRLCTRPHEKSNPQPLDCCPRAVTTQPTSHATNSDTVCSISKKEPDSLRRCWLLEVSGCILTSLICCS